MLTSLKIFDPSLNNFITDIKTNIQCYEFGNYAVKITVTSPKGQGFFNIILYKELTADLQRFGEIPPPSVADYFFK